MRVLGSISDSTSQPSPHYEDVAQKFGFAVRGEDDFADNLSMTIESFLSTTNIIAAVERGATLFDDVARWIKLSIAPFFAEQAQRTFLFSGKSWYLQKTIA